MAEKSREKTNFPMCIYTVANIVWRNAEGTVTTEPRKKKKQNENHRKKYIYLHVCIYIFENHFHLFFSRRWVVAITFSRQFDDEEKNEEEENKCKKSG